MELEEPQERVVGKEESNAECQELPTLGKEKDCLSEPRAWQRWEGRKVVLLRIFAYVIIPKQPCLHNDLRDPGVTV